MTDFTVPVMGSITDAVIDILKTDTNIQALAPDNIGRDMIGYDRSKKWIVVARQGGTYAWPKHAHPRVDVNCYAPYGGDAEDMIEMCVAVMLRKQPASYRGHGIILCAAKIETSPFESSDKLTGSCRYVVAFRLTVRPDIP